METNLLTKYFGTKDSHSIEFYLGHDGYKTAEKAIKTKSSEDIKEEVKKSGLRGRGGAGFPTGVKWGFLPKETDKPIYLCINADEGEPGTFRDKYVMEYEPHLLIEGIILASYAIKSNMAFIYIRGEYQEQFEILEKALEEAYQKGFIGKNIFGTNYNLDIVLHKGAGAYICGEETALINSLEGEKGQPRIKPPFPATEGLFGCPTIVNNVVTIASLPWIIENGADSYKEIGTSQSSGTFIYSISGHVNKPGIYELPMGLPLKDLIYKYAGGIKDNKKLKKTVVVFLLCK